MDSDRLQVLEDRVGAYGDHIGNILRAVSRIEGNMDQQPVLRADMAQMQEDLTRVKDAAVVAQLGRQE